MANTRTSKISRIAALPCGKRTKYLVVVFWLVVVAVTGSLAGKLQGAERNDASSYLPTSAESTQELNLQAKFTSPNLNPAVVVYTRPSGITAADLRKAEADARIFAALPAVHGRVTGPIPSADHQALETIVGADLGYNANISGFINGLNATASAGDPGLTVHITGPAASAADEIKIFKGIDTTLLFATLAVVIVLLLITYRSPVLWLLPIMSAGVALTVAEAVIYLLTQHGLTVNGQSAGILVVLVLGAGTDYALLLIARYREELRRHEDRHEAMAVALRRAGPAIIASGATVIAGMLCLLAADSADISGLGPVAAIGIAVGLVAMITLLPALLVIFGRWIFWPLRPRYGSAEPTASGLWARTGRAIATPPARGVGGHRGGTRLLHARPDRLQDRLADHGAVVPRHPGLGGRRGGARAALPGRRGRARRRDRQRDRRRGRCTAPWPAPRASPRCPRRSPADDLVYLQGTLNSQPVSQAAFATVDRVRAAVHQIPGADAKVGGGTAVTMDVENYAARDRNVIIPLVLLVVMIILGLLLRAVVAPLVLIGTVILSFGTALGLSALAFRHAVRLRGRGHLGAAVHLRVPGRPGHRLQHLPDDPGPRGDHQVGHPARRHHRAGRDRRRDHLGGPGAGRHVRHARHAAAGDLHRDRLRGRARRPAGHDHCPVRAGHRADHRHRALDVVAEPARPATAPRRPALPVPPATPVR